MPLFTILSIDGGGIRGIIPAMILAEIERRTGYRIAQMFDLIAGTSTGGVLALGLTIPQSAEVQRPKYKASQLVSFYEQDGQEVFHSFWQNVTSLHGLLDEKYPSERFEKVLRKYMGDETRLSEALTEVLITSYEIESCRPFFFTRQKGTGQENEPAQSSDVGGRTLHIGRADLFLSVSDQAGAQVEPAAADAHRRRRLRQQPQPSVPTPRPSACSTVPLTFPRATCFPGGSKQSERPVEVRSRER